MGGVRDSHRGAGSAAPTNRALVIGSETGGLQGVHRDAEAIAAALTGLGFTVTLAIEGAATRDGIVARYRGLIEDSKAEDAAVIYYSGHGGRQRNPLADSDPSVPAWFQFIVPTDINDMSSGFRGVLAEELSLLQLELTQKTRNVTAIFDCCHSARMSRDAGALPKADSQLPAFPWDDVRRRWEAARHDPRAQAAPGDSNPDAVRVVACSPDESAYELPNTPLGGRHGALTGTLVPVLQSAVARSLTWRGVLDYLRPAVLEMVPQQRPEIEGPLDRLLFRTETRDETGVLPVVVRNGVALLEGAALLGMAEGDTYDLVAPGADRAAPLTTATIDRIAGDQARLHLGRGAPASLPAGTSAYPVRVALGARPVAIVPAGDPRRASVVAALEGSPAVRLVEGTTNVMATVQIGDAGLQLLDPCGEPLLERPAPLDAVGYTRVATDLRLLARATHVRELASGAGPAELPDDVTIGCTRLLPDGTEVALARSGEHLFAGDRVVVRIRNQSAEKRFVNVVDIGVAGAVCVVTSAEPGGTTLEAGEAYVLGENGAGARTGIELGWPEHLPAGGPRPETLVVITSDAKVDGVARLAQAGARDAGGGPPAATALDRLLDGATSGRRDFRLPPAESRPTRYRVQRVDFVLHSEPRVGEADEPAFEVDERPDPSFRLVTPRGAQPPARVAVRLKELTVHSNRALLSAAVRIDALVVTAPPEGSGEPYTAATARFDRVKDGDRLPFDDLLVYEGPVGRFVDLAVWVTKDDQRELDLADLLVKETGDMDLKGAVATLAGLAATAPQAAAVAGAAAAVAVVVRTGARLLDTLEGKSIGVYRTSLLPHQRFGASDQPPGAGRHPAQGLIRAQDMSFAFEVVDLSLVGTPSPPTTQSPTQGGDAP